MSADRSYEFASRIAILLTNEAHRRAAAQGLDLVHLRTLLYLDRANHYSNTPAAVTEYLGLTKGTVSQSISVLQRRGLLDKRPDPLDRRVVRLHLSPAGQALVTQFNTHAAWDEALRQLGAAQAQALELQFEQLLQALRSAIGWRSFGVCTTCSRHAHALRGAACLLTGEPIPSEHLEHICREHQPLGTAQREGVGRR